MSNPIIAPKQNVSPEIDPDVRVTPRDWTPLVDWRHCRSCGDCVDACPRPCLGVEGDKPCRL